MARKWHGSKWLRPSTRLAIYERDGNACLQCGASHDLTVDHRAPVSRGGTNDPRNLLTLCFDCNRRKGGRTVRAWLAALAAAGVDVDALRARMRRASRRALPRARAREILVARYTRRA